MRQGITVSGGGGYVHIDSRVAIGFRYRSAFTRRFGMKKVQSRDGPVCPGRLNGRSPSHALIGRGFSGSRAPSRLVASGRPMCDLALAALEQRQVDVVQCVADAASWLAN